MDKNSRKKVLGANQVELKQGVGDIKTPDPQVEVGGIQFPDLGETETSEKFGKDMFAQIPINVTVELGRTQMSLQHVLELQEGSIIELERMAGEPLDLVVNGQLIARGEVVAIDDHYGLRIIEIISKV